MKFSLILYMIALMRPRKERSEARFCLEHLEQRVLLSAAIPSEPASQPTSGGESIQATNVTAAVVEGRDDGMPELSGLDLFGSLDPKALEPDGGEEHMAAQSLSARAVWTGDIPSGTVWGSGEVQRVSGGATVPFGTTLTIQPGAIIKFEANATLIVRGDLEALGTADSHIIFTSIRDDTVGGDTNGDGSTTSPAAGDWHDIAVAASSPNLGLANISNAEIRFGGKSSGAHDGELVNSGGVLNASNNLISQSFGDGINITSGKATLANNSLRDLVQYGIRATGNDPLSITGNTIFNATSGPILTKASTSQTLSGNQSSGSGLANAIQMMGGSISDAEQWNDNLPYYLPEGVTVGATGTLTIAAGGILKFAPNMGIRVNGQLIAVGTEVAPITFTSFKDDTVGGDTNGDGAISTPAAGDWDSIFTSGAGPKATLDHARVLYGGKLNGSPDVSVAAFGGELTVQNSVVADSFGEGIWISSGKGTITANSVSRTGRFGIRVDPSDPAVTFIVTGNQVTRAGSGPISIHAGAQITLSGNSSSGSGLADFIRVLGGTINTAQAWDEQLNYYLAENVTIGSTGSLTLRPGLIVKFGAGNQLRADGQLNASGTDAAPIIFTSFKDDSFGGDTNADGQASSPAAGDWDAIFTTGKGKLTLDHARVLYGGKANGSPDVAVGAFGGEITVQNSVVADSFGEGIWVSSGKGTISANSVSRIARFGIRVDPTDPATTFVVTGNHVASAKSGAVSFHAGALITLSGNSSSGSGLADFIRVLGGTINTAQVWDEQLNFYVAENVTVSSTGALTFRPGLIVKFGTGDQLRVEGRLNATGTEAAPVVFTSFKDDAFGGDTNGDAQATTPASGDWDSVFTATTSATLTLDHAQFFYGGKSGTSRNTQIGVFGGELIIQNSRLSDSFGEGIWVSSGKATIQNNVISRTARFGVRMETNDAVNLTGNQIDHALAGPISIPAGTPQVLSGNRSTDSGLANFVRVTGGNIKGDRSWDEALNFFISDQVTVEAGASLTLRPGLIVKFAPAVQLTVSGQINAVGTETDPIIFTSAKDDSFGGDTNGDGAASAPAAGDWDRIYLKGPSANGTKGTFAFSKIFYSGKLATGVPDSGISASRAELIIRNSVVANVLGEGIWIESASATLQNNSISNATRYGVFLHTTSPVTLMDNKISNARLGPLHMSAGLALTAANNTSTGSGLADSVLVDGGTISTNQNWNDGFATYVVNGAISVNSGVTWQIAPGRVLKFRASGQLNIQGAFLAQGTSDAPITFTSENDDSVGGDVNADQDAVKPAAGDWDRIWVNGSTATVRLDHVVIRYSGTQSGTGIKVSVLTSAGTLDLKNSTVEFGAGDGISVFNGVATVDNTKIENVAGYGLRVDDTSHHAVFTNGSITRALAAPVYQRSDGDVDLTGTVFNNCGRANAIFMDGGSVNGIKTWRGDTTYWVTDNLSIGGTLTILPGAILKFQKYKGIQVSGTLNVPGNQAAPGALSGHATFTVTFTSARDDIGGDTNGDGSATLPGPGDWFNIWDRGGSVNMANVEINFAGVEQIGTGFAGTPALLKDGGQVTLRDAVIQANFDVGLRDRSSSGGLAVINGRVFVNNNQPGIDITSSDTVRLQNILFDDPPADGGGIDLRVVPSTKWTLDGVEFTGNPRMDVVGNGSIGSNWTLGQIPVVVFAPNSNVTVDNPGSLTILPGTIIKLGANATLVGNAPIYINGDASRFIDFTSIKDDSLGGDTNGDGLASEPAPGDWGYLGFFLANPQQRPQSQLSFARFHFGGGAAFGANPASTLAIQGPTASGFIPLFSANNLVVEHSGGGGIDILGAGTVTLQNTVISNNAATGVYRPSNNSSNLILTNDTIFGGKTGLFVDSPNVTITNTIITGASVAGVQSANAAIHLGSHFNIFYNPAATLGNFSNSNLQNWNPTDPVTDIFLDPLLVNPGIGDFLPGPGSPAIDSADGNLAPGFDFFGNPRRNDTGVPNTGIGFLRYADRGAVEKLYSGGGDDLIIPSVSLSFLGRDGNPIDPQTALPAKIGMNFTILNDGNDSLDLPNFVSEGFLQPVFPGEQPRDQTNILLGSFSAHLVVGPNAQVQLSHVFDLPLIETGLYRGGVLVDTGDDVHETAPFGELNNSGLADQIFQLRNPQVVPGTLTDLDLSGPGHGVVFDPANPLGITSPLTPFSVTITPPVPGTFFEGTGDGVPGPGNNSMSVPLLPGQPNTIEGFYQQGTEFSILVPGTVPDGAHLQVQFFNVRDGFLNDVFPREAGNSGLVTFRFMGGPFANGSEPLLSNSQGTLFHPVEVTQTEDRDEILGRFNLNGAPPGDYVPIINWGDGTQSRLPSNGAIQVINGGAGQFQLNVTGPDIVRAGVPMPFTFTWNNTGFTDLPVNFVNVPLPNGVHIAMGPNQKEQTNGLSFLTFVGQSTNSTVLPAQSSGSLDVWVRLDPVNPNVVFLADANPIDAPALGLPFDVGQALDEVKPATVDPARWDPMAAKVRADAGNTLGAFVSYLAKDANLDPASAGNGEISPARIDQLIRGGAGETGNLLADKMAAAYPAPSNPKQGDGIHQDFVILIAIEDYSHSVGVSFQDVPGVPGKVLLPFVNHNLEGTQVDADGWTDFFSNTLNIGSSQITVLRDHAGNDDDNVTFDKIQKAWQDTVAKADADDKIKFVYSGHGSRNGGAMVMNSPYDGLNSQYVNAAKLRDLFAQNPGKTYAVFDSCFSQQLGLGLNDMPNVAWNSAVGTDQTASDSPSFSSFLLAAYRDMANDKNHDGAVWISEAFKAAQKAYNNHYKDGQIDDQKTPHSGGDPAVDQELHDDLGNAARNKPWTQRITDALKPLAKRAVKTITNVFARDPNEKIGPAGFGQDNFVPNQQMNFAVYFENDPEQANAAAQVVVVTDRLDSALDWTTFQFGEVAIGERTFLLAGSQTNVSTQVYLPEQDVGLLIQGRLDLQTGIVQWTFITLDPTTNLPTKDPLAGFLPPDLAKPEGEGHVTYTVSPKAGLPHGTLVKNSAVIIFDQNAPIPTNELSYHIDAQGPQVQKVQINTGPQRSRLNQIQITFSEDTLLDVPFSAFSLVNKATGKTISLAETGMSIDSTGRIITLDTELSLPAGNYTFTVKGSAVADAGGITMAQDSQTNFHIQPGDANGDRVVNDLDLYRVWQNQLKAVASRDPNDDLNADGKVDETDLAPVQDNYLAIVLAPASLHATERPVQPANDVQSAALTGDRGSSVPWTLAPVPPGTPGNQTRQAVVVAAAEEEDVMLAENLETSPAAVSPAQGSPVSSSALRFAPADIALLLPNSLLAEFDAARSSSIGLGPLRFMTLHQDLLHVSDLVVNLEKIQQPKFYAEVSQVKARSL